tara:strand:- start:279 stop:845 length:567 start_codon:yes stop_codon:yes gene_type:complete
MGSQSERRALYYESDESYDPTLSVDINEYLIETYPVLNLKQRTSVWTLCQNDEDFDFSDIYDQIDDKVFEYAETDESLNAEDLYSEDKDEDEDDLEDGEDGEENDPGMMFIVDAKWYFNEVWPELDDDQIAGVIEYMNDDESIDLSPVYDMLDEYVQKYADEVDNSIDTSVADDDSTDDDTADEESAE